MVAVGIGLHNFAEGLAIGNSAANEELSLALLLVLGFALHNATEGFGIVAPLAGDLERPSWGRLALWASSRPTRSGACRLWAGAGPT
jgi:ZIP family zinc transporter